METQKLSERESKALAIATHTQLVRKPNNTWIVPSQSGAKTYTVNPDPESLFCDCPDFEYRRARCKHVLAVEIVLKREIVTVGNTQTVTETLTVKQKYTQDWPSYNKHRQTRRPTSLNSCISFALASKNRYRQTDALVCRSRTLSLRRLTKLTRWLVQDGLRAICVTHW
jgi:SWIM zinc finger